MMNQWIICLTLKILFQLCAGTSISVVPGSKLELPCFTFPAEHSEEPISWKFNGEDIISSDSVAIIGTHLSISPVNNAHEGEYACSVRDPILDTERRKTYSVVVTKLARYTVVVREGGRAYLPCNYQPDQQVRSNAVWYISKRNEKLLTQANGTESRDGRAVLLFHMDYDQTLSINDVTMIDEGRYSCEASDDLTLSVVDLVVLSAPTPPPHSCDGFTTPWEKCEGDNENSRITGPVLRESLTDFSFKLYSIFGESRQQKNLLYSPLSISGALTHLLLGSRNKSRAALEGALSLPPKFHCVHSEMKKLREKLSVSLQMASQIFYNTEFNLTTSFIKQSAEYYDSEPVKLKEDSQENVRMINSWVAEKTQNKITELVKDVSQQTKLMVLNAVSFNGLWVIKFNEKPSKGYFTKLDGDMIKVPVLRNDAFEGSMAFVSELRAQVMRFELTGNNSLYILLPQSNKASDLQLVESRLRDAAVRQMIDQIRETTPERIQVTLPKIKLNTEEDLNFMIKKLGLFSLYEEPNLCGLYTQEPLVLEEAKHKAFLSLTEQGVEAAAVTAMGFSRSQMSFSALRPFLLLLWSDSADVPLFIGRVMEP